MLEIKNLFAGYGSSEVLHGATARFERGRLTAVIGKIGSGKSTLINATLGILKIKSGEITVDGDDLLTLKRAEIARRIAYLPQGGGIPDMTVGELVISGRFPYLSYPRRYTERDREIALRSMESLGISHLADTPLQRLSGGMRRTAHIAMALAEETDYILLDEPTAFLDIAHQIELVKMLKKLAETGRGAVAVMHDLPLAFTFADEIAVMDSGRVILQGEPREILDTGAVKELLGVSLAIIENGSYAYSYDK